MKLVLILMSGVESGGIAGDWMLGEWTEWKVSVTVQEGKRLFLVGSRVRIASVGEYGLSGVHEGEIGSVGE